MAIDRRTLLNGGVLGAIAGFGGLTSTSLADSVRRSDGPPTGHSPTAYGLTMRQKAKPAALAYTPGGKALGAPTLPYVYVFYDPATKKFQSALDVVPDSTIDVAKSYTLSSKLHAFNIRKEDQQRFASLQNNVQLAFNVSAPNPLGDLTWVFMNAIDIFGGGSHPDAGKLTTFLQGASPGAALASQPKVTITKGTLSLQVLAYGQKKNGFWKSFFDFVNSVIGNPIAATALTGFGIPGLAVDALQFVDHAITELTKNEGLQPLWQTGSLDFGIDPHTKALFKMRSGIWLVVDHDYAETTDILQGHTLDLALGSYRLLDMNKNAANANYLVSDFLIDATS